MRELIFLPSSPITPGLTEDQTAQQSKYYDNKEDNSLDAYNIIILFYFRFWKK